MNEDQELVARLSYVGFNRKRKLTDLQVDPPFNIPRNNQIIVRESFLINPLQYDII